MLKLLLISATLVCMASAGFLGDIFAPKKCAATTGATAAASGGADTIIGGLGGGLGGIGSAIGGALDGKQSLVDTVDGIGGAVGHIVDGVLNVTQRALELGFKTFVHDFNQFKVSIKLAYFCCPGQFINKLVFLLFLNV